LNDKRHEIFRGKAMRNRRTVGLAGAAFFFFFCMK